MGRGNTTTGNFADYWNDKLGFGLEKDIAMEEAAREHAVSSVGTLEDGVFNKQEAIALVSKDANFLAAVAIPDIYKFPFPPILLAAWQLLVDSATVRSNGFPQIALGIPRGHAKTTMVKLYMLYCILFTKKTFILVIGNTAANAENIIADVSDMLDGTNIISLFGDWKLGREISRQDMKKFNFRGRSIVIAALGAEGSVRGLNVKNQRPDVMIFEDVQTKECSESQIMSTALERWMFGTAMKAKSPGGCVFIYVGNMYPGPNSILKKLKNNKTWIKFISGAILEDGTALWPELRSIESLIEELNNDIAAGHPEIFFSEVLNDTEAGINNRTDLSSIKGWQWSDTDFPQGKFILIDPASNKLGGDDVSIGYFEIYDGIPALRELIEKNISPGNTIREALLMAIRTKTRIIVIESTAYQYSLLYWFEQVCDSYGITGISAQPIYTGSYSKNSRITDMLKALTSGEIGIHENVRHSVVHQIANWSPIRRNNVDGILDLLSYAPRVVEMYPNECMVDDTLDMFIANSAEVISDNTPF